ncbi:MAG: hemolysin family protein [Desulfobacteraceae bacterium]|nr:hemolysin family protein [Desulfobacteraceae bacterium]
MLSGILDVFVVGVLILLNGIFAMSELAVIASRKVRLQQRAEEGDRRAEAALGLAGNPQRFLSTIQIGITLVGVLSGAFGGASLARDLAQPLSSVPYIGEYSESISLAIVVGFITYLSLLSELVPKRLALSKPEDIASSVAAPMKALSRVAAPAIYILSVSTEFLLRFVRFRPAQEPSVTEEEIRVLLGQATLAGVFQEAEQQMVERVFRFGDRRVGVMMTPRNKVEWLDLGDPPEKIRRKIARSFFSRFPIAQGRFGNILGLVHVRDIAARLLSGKPLDLKACMHRPLYVPESMHALNVLELFRKSGQQMALVVDEYGTIEGIVTLSDILEAIVGDIPSAESPENPRIFQRDDASWLVDGMLPVDELKDQFHIRKLPGERAGRFQTVSGFAMAHLKRIPVEGDRFECCGYRFEVVDMDGHRVDKVIIEKMDPPSDAEPPENEAN